MEHPPADGLFGPALDGDGERVVRCRLKAEEYRTIADQTRNARARATFAALAEFSERMAADAQGRIQAQRTLDGRRKITRSET